jgi:hypothetical protein
MERQAEGDSKETDRTPGWARLGRRNKGKKACVKDKSVAGGSAPAD